MNITCALSLSKPVLCVGTLSLDLLTLCSLLPEEDTVQNSISSEWQRGGHASNVSYVLRLLSAQVEFLGMLSRSQLLREIKKDMDRNSINMNHCPKTDEEPAFSTILVSRRTKGRTVIHCNRQFPYVTIEDFRKLDLSLYGWVHFEARCVRETVRMMRDIWDYNNGRRETERIRISLRVNADYWNNKDLFDMCDHVLVSRTLAMQLGWENAEQACLQMDNDLRLPRYIIRRRPCFICSWSRLGAGCLNENGIYEHLPPRPAPRCVDSYGVGACFTAAFIYAIYARSMGLSAAVDFANRVAGHKTSSVGYNHISQLNIYPTSNLKKVTDVPSCPVSEDEETEVRVCSKYLNRKIKYSDGKLSTKLLNIYVPPPTNIESENPSRDTEPEPNLDRETISTGLERSPSSILRKPSSRLASIRKNVKIKIRRAK